jgi:hypothetical protein
MNYRIKAVCFGLISMLALFSGCTRKTQRSAGTPDNVLAYGVYTATALDSGLSVKLSLNQTATYSKKKFQGSCFVMEYKGEWTCDNQSIEFHLTETRQRPDCGNEDWRIEKVDKHTRRLIRSVTMSSFELLDQDDQSSDEWVKFVKR